MVPPGKIRLLGVPVVGLLSGSVVLLGEFDVGTLSGSLVLLGVSEAGVLNCSLVVPLELPSVLPGAPGIVVLGTVSLNVPEDGTEGVSVLLPDGVVVPGVSLLLPGSCGVTGTIC